MGDQATVNGSRTDGQDQEEGVVGNITGFANDVATLVELQAKLASLDFQDCASRAKLPLIATAAGALIVLGSVPVVVGGLGLILAEAFRLSNGLGLLIAGGVVILLAGLVAAFSALRAARSLESFRRTREELGRNLLWLKTVLTYSGRPAPRRRF